VPAERRGKNVTKSLVLKKRGPPRRKRNEDFMIGEGMEKVSFYPGGGTVPKLRKGGKMGGHARARL